MARYTSTKDPLGASEEYISDILNVGGLDSIRGIATSDVEGNLTAEHSIDGEEWLPGESFALDADGVVYIDVKSYGPYLRFKYVNGGSDQTSFVFAIRVRESPSFSEGGGSSPGSDVTSVNGYTGDVTLNANDVGAASLVGGKVPSSQIPDIAITSTHVVPDRAGMLALNVQPGDVAVVEVDDDSESRTYILADDPPTDFSNWVELSSPGNVTSVNGEVGVVNLIASDVGAMTALGTGTGTRVSVTAPDGAESARQVASGSATFNSFALRTGSGQVKVANASAADDAINKGQLDNPTSLGITGNSRVPVAQAGAWVSNGYLVSAAAQVNSIPFRDSSGRMKSVNGVAADDVTTVAQIDAKLDKITGPAGAYVWNGTIQTLAPFTAGSTASTLVYRDAAGRSSISDPVADSNIANKRYVDSALSPAQRTAINALPTTGATIDDVVAALKAV